MLTYWKAKKLLCPGETVYSLTEDGAVAEVKILEICDGWLESTIGILDFDDHGCTWWLTRKVAMEGRT
jgi:hypothetical protein